MTAVITDVKYRMALSLIRDLSDRGIKITACHSGEGRPFAFSSKKISRTRVLPDPASDPDGYLDALYELCLSMDEKPALLPVGAATLGLLALPENHERFAAVCGLCIPEKDSLDTANDKAALAALAKEIGVPTPESYEISSPDDFFALDYPLVVKPVCGEKQGLPAEKRYMIVRTPQQGQKAYAAFTFGGVPPVVQRCLEGAGLGFSVMAKDGVIINSICHKRLREYPLSGGPSTCCVTSDGGFLRKYAEMLVKALNFTGVAMIEFKLDSQAHPYLLEINPRIWGTFPLTRASGSSFGYDWYALSMGLEPERTPPRTGVRMYYLPSDMRRSAAALRAGNTGEAFKAVGDWFSPKTKEGIFEFSDIKGSMAYLGSYLKRGRK